MTVVGFGTIEDLVADARDAGHEVTVRMVRDWCARGLLDQPQRRPSGRGKGSRPALYSENQRHLFLLLLQHRRSVGIPSLARLPVAVWLLWGDEFVPTRQALRAIGTWLGDGRSNKEDSSRFARELVAQLGSVASNEASRSGLVSTLADLAYCGRLDDRGALRAAVGAVFDAGFVTLGRAVGDPSAPLTTDAVVAVIEATAEGARLVLAGAVSGSEFERAREVHLETLGEYSAAVPSMAASDFGAPAGFYSRPTLEGVVTSCCRDLLMILGLEHMRAAGG